MCTPETNIRPCWHQYSIAHACWQLSVTLDKGHPLHVPVKLAAYHRQAIEGKTLNTSTTLHKRHGVWWLTLSFDEDVRSSSNRTISPLCGRRCGHRQFYHDLDGKTVRQFSRHTRPPSQARPGKAPQKGQVTGLLAKEGSRNTAFHEQRHGPTPWPPCAARDQPSGQSSGSGSPQRSPHLRRPLGGLDAF